MCVCGGGYILNIFLDTYRKMYRSEQITRATYCVQFINNID